MLKEVRFKTLERDIATCYNIQHIELRNVKKDKNKKGRGFFMTRGKETLKKDRIELVRKDIKANKYMSIGIVAFIVVTLIIFFYLSMERTYGGYKIVSSNSKDGANIKGYMSYGNDKIIKYSCDGITVMNRDEEALWKASYEMKNPNVVINEDGVAVADIGGNEIYVYDKDGNANRIENSHTIEQVRLAKNGIVALATKEKMANYITVLDKNKKYLEIKTSIKEDGYLLDMAFSDNAQKLVTSYVNAKEGVCDNYVTFYNFGEVGKNYESKIVKAESYGETMVPRVEFLDENTICTFLEDKMVVYDMKEIPKKRFETEQFDRKIKSILFDKEHIGAILENDNENIIMIYDMEGKEILKKSVNYEYKKAYLSKEDVILYTEEDAQIYRISGKMKLKCTFNDGNVECLLPYNNRDKFFMITAEKTNVIKLIE